jgi:hypothetical protein
VQCVLETGNRKGCGFSFAYVTSIPILFGCVSGGGRRTAFLVTYGDVGAAVFQPQTVVCVKCRYVIALAALDGARVDRTRSDTAMENHFLRTQPCVWVYFT